MRKILGFLILSMMFLSCSKDSGENPLQEVKDTEVTEDGFVTQKVRFNLNVEAEYNTDNLKIKDSQMRSLDVKLTPEGANKELKIVVPDGGVDVLCYFRDTNKIKTAQKVLHFDKVKGEDNKIIYDDMVELDIKVKAGYENWYKSEVKKGETWYMTAVIGGKYDEATKHFDFDPNKTTAPALSVKTETELFSGLDIPALAKWTKLAPLVNVTDANTGTTTVNFDYKQGSTTRTPIRLTFYSQGMLIRHRIAENKTNHTIVVKGFKVVTNSFSFKGYYDLSGTYGKTYLEKSVTTITGNRNSQMFNWSAFDAKSGCITEESKKFLPASNNSRPEWHLDVTLAQPLTLAPNATAKDKVMVFWAMPIGIDASVRKTNIYLNAVIEGEPAITADQPKMMLLNTYGSKHEMVQRQFQSGDAAYMTSVIERPKLGAEYVAEHNLKTKQKFTIDPATGLPMLRNNPHTIKNMPGTTAYTYVTGSSSEFAGTGNQKDSFGFNETSMLRYKYAVESANAINGWHLPSYKEMCTILPGFDGEEFINVDAIGQDYQVREDKYSTAPATLIPSPVDPTKTLDVKLGANEGSTTIIVHNDRVNDVTYAIHFKDFTPNGEAKTDSYQIAYRYRFLDNPNTEVSAINSATYPDHNIYFDEHYDAPISGIGKGDIYNEYNSDANILRDFHNYNSNTCKKYLVVDMIYLSKNFLGEIGDVSTPSFWEIRKVDMVTRYFPMSYVALGWVKYNIRGLYTYKESRFGPLKEGYLQQEGYDYLTPNTLSLWMSEPLQNVNKTVWASMKPSGGQNIVADFKEGMVMTAKFLPGGEGRPNGTEFTSLNKAKAYYGEGAIKIYKVGDAYGGSVRLFSDN